MTDSSPRLLFGQIAVLARLITEEQRAEALRIQAKGKQSGTHFYLGTILVNRGHLTIPQALDILKYQQVQIVVDSSTGNFYNIHSHEQKKKYRSPESTEILKVPDRIESLIVRGDLGLRKVTREDANRKFTESEKADFELGGTAPPGPGAASDDPFSTGSPGGSAAGDDDPFGTGGGSGDPFGVESPATAGGDGADPFGDPFGATQVDDGSLAAQAANVFGEASNDTADPFGGGGGAGSDPFSAGGGSDPFSDSAGSDPFSSSSATGDSFGGGDPFGGGGGDASDPFGDTAAAAGGDMDVFSTNPGTMAFSDLAAHDPFGGGADTAADDPFASASTDDPFASASTAGDDPFGGSGAGSDDPFGGSAAAPAPAASGSNADGWGDDDGWGAGAPPDASATVTDSDDPFGGTPAFDEPVFGGGGIENQGLADLAESSMANQGGADDGWGDAPAPAAGMDSEIETEPAPEGEAYDPFGSITSPSGPASTPDASATWSDNSPFAETATESTFGDDPFAAASPDDPFGTSTMPRVRPTDLVGDSPFSTPADAFGGGDDTADPFGETAADTGEPIADAAPDPFGTGDSGEPTEVAGELGGMVVESVEQTADEPAAEVAAIAGMPAQTPGGDEAVPGLEGEVGEMASLEGEATAPPAFDDEPAMAEADASPMDAPFPSSDFVGATIDYGEFGAQHADPPPQVAPTAYSDFGATEADGQDVAVMQADAFTGIEVDASAGVQEEKTDVDIQAQARAREEKTDADMAARAAAAALVGRGSGEYRALRSPMARWLVMAAGLAVLVVAGLYVADILRNDGANADDTMKSIAKTLGQPDSIKGVIPPPGGVSPELMSALREARGRFQDTGEFVGTNLIANQGKFEKLVDNLTKIISAVVESDSFASGKNGLIASKQLVPEVPMLITELDYWMAALDAWKAKYVAQLKAQVKAMRERKPAAMANEATKASLIEAMTAFIKKYGDPSRRELGLEAEIKDLTRDLGELKLKPVTSVAEFKTVLAEYLGIAPAKANWAAQRETLMQQITRSREIMQEWKDSPSANSEFTTYKPHLDTIGKLNDLMVATFDSWWVTTPVNHQAVYDGMMALKKLDGLKKLEGSVVSSIDLSWIDRHLTTLLGEWGNAQVELARADLQTMTDKRSTLSFADASSWVAKIRNHLEAINSYKLTPSASAQVRAKIVSDAEAIATTARTRENLDTVMADLRKAVAAESWPMVRELSEQVQKVLDTTAGIENADAVRAESTMAWKRAGWFINLQSGDAAWTAALAEGSDLTDADRRDLWGKAATAYGELMNESMWAADGYPNAYTALAPWEHTRDPQVGYERWNIVLERATLAPAWQGYYAGRVLYPEAEAAYVDDPSRPRDKFEACGVAFERALNVFRNFPSEAARTAEIKLWIQKALIRPTGLDAEIELKTGKEALAAKQFEAARTAFNRARLVLNSVITAHERSVPGEVENDRKLLAVAEQGLADATRMAEEFRLEDLLANGNQREAMLLQQLDNPGAPRADVVAGANDLLNDYTTAANNPKASSLTLRVFRARTARVAVVKMLAEASAAIEANDVARAVANLSDADVKSTLWPDLGARARILLHKATADVRTARNKLGMVQVTGNGDTVGDYWIDRTEVSNKDYAAFLEWLQSVSYDDSTVRHPDQPAAVDPRHMPRFWNVRGADDMPVVGVSYWDAVAYATWAGKQLPDADEWEWAARGGQAASRFPWGDEPQISNANAGSNGANGPVAVNADPNAATPTGILHMAGNVREWTDTATQHDGIPMQVVKGGSFRSPLSELLNATRVERRATHTDDRTGFRCVMRTPR